MSVRIKVILQYVILLSLTVFLVWFSLRGLKTSGDENAGEILLKAWQQADKGWLLAMAAVAFASHIIRAERWRMLIEPSKHKTTLVNSFLSLMVGYLVNLVIPRGGEVSRCYNLYKLDKTPVETSFGTVITERIVDVICLLILVGFSFLNESKRLLEFIATLPLDSDKTSNFKTILLIVILIVIVAALGLYLLFKFNTRFRTFFVKTFSGFKDGLLSIFRLKRPVLFIVYSIVIWGLYFLMSLTVIKAFPSTESLGLDAVLSLFAIGAIAMAAPLPAGTGSYHVLVPQGLAFLYSVPKSDAIAFTFIFHGWQTLIMIIGGAVSIIVTNVIIRKKKTA